MAFEIYQKRGHLTRGLKDNEISVSNSSITFGKLASENLMEGYVEVYLDREERVVGLKPSSSSIKGFKIHVGQKSPRKFISGTFAKLVKKGRYLCRFERGFVVFEVPEIAQR